MQSSEAGPEAEAANKCGVEEVHIVDACNVEKHQIESVV